MSSSGSGISEGMRMPESTLGDGAEGEPTAREAGSGWQPASQRLSDGPGESGPSRKRRRRQRPQRGKRRRPGQGGGVHVDLVSRERMFQELEGLLRQIREQAEENEGGGWREEDVNEIAQAVSSFTKYLEEQSDPISERTRGEYQRLREKLSQAVKGNRN